MYKKIIFTLIFVVISLYGIAQKNLNDYKYIIIPTTFKFSKSEDQYRLNSLTKFLFNKYGYEAYSPNELPEDLKNNRCLALTADVSNDQSGMFKTKLEIVLKDCYDAVVVQSQIGESRLKDYSKSYNEALRGAFETFRNFDYEYVAAEVVVKSKAKKPQEEKPSVTKILEVEEVTEALQSKTEKNENTLEATIKNSDDAQIELYYAQSIPNGYQLVNSEPKVVMILLNSSAKDVFIVKDKNAIVFNKEGQWIYSENNGASTIEKILNIKF